MDSGSMHSSGTSDSEDARGSSGHSTDLNDLYLANERLCSALLWSAKIAAKTQQRQQQQGKNKRVNWKNPALYKTRLCDYWSTGNPCKFGLNCWYAHGPVELRHVPRLDKDPVATSISLAEVVQRLPPSRDRSIALEQAETQLIANIKSDAFVKHAVQEITCRSPNSLESPASTPSSPLLEPAALPKPASNSRLPFFEQISARKQAECKLEVQESGLESAFDAYQPYLNGVMSLDMFNNSAVQPSVAAHWNF